ncbi:MAG: DNA methyltransferase [Pseudomonadota bacterium]
MQQTLFDLGDIKHNTPTNGNGTSFSDPAFASNKVEPIHRWVPWIAGFSSIFVRDAVNRYLPKQGRILDPFAGVGTTLVESVLAGHSAIGFEINPYAALVCQVKGNSHRISPKALRGQIRRFQKFYSDKMCGDCSTISSPPKGFKGKVPFYSPKVLHRVLLYLDFIATVEGEQLRNLFRLAFASTMVRYSNYSYEPSLSTRQGAGKKNVDDFAVAEVIVDKLMEMANDVEWFQSKLTKNHGTSQVVNSSFFGYQDHLAPESIDLIVTSPPYLNNYHYNRNTRPHLYWLGFVESPVDMRPLEQHNFGKFWQTVRDLGRLDLTFSLPDTDLEERLQLLRSLNPEKKVYGGNGWANYAAAYFDDCVKFAKGIDYALRPGGTALVVIGNSILQGVSIPTDVYFGKIAESIGLDLVDIHVPRATRVGNSIIKSDIRVAKAKKSHHLYEAVVEVRKP